MRSISQEKSKKNNSQPSIALRSEQGLTLVEVIAVIILIGLVGGVLFRGIFAQSEGAKAQINTVRMQKLKSALSNYRLQFNSYPKSLNGLVSPTGDVKKNGKLFTPFAEEADLSDVWNNPYQYNSDGRTFKILSLGADGAPGGSGADQDISIP